MIAAKRRKHVAPRVSVGLADKKQTEAAERRHQSLTGTLLESFFENRTGHPVAVPRLRCVFWTVYPRLSPGATCLDRFAARMVTSMMFLCEQFPQNPKHGFCFGTNPNKPVTVFYTTNQPVATRMKAWVFDITYGDGTKIITLVPLAVAPPPSSFAIGPPPGGWRTGKTYQVVIQIDNATGGTPLIFDSKYPFSFVIDVNGNWIVTTPTTGGPSGG